MSFNPDSEILDNEYLYRAIHPNFWKEDENRPSTALFKDKKGVSVDRDGEREEKDIIQFLLRNRTNYGAGKLNAGETKEVGIYLKPDKLPDNEYHALILDPEKIILPPQKQRSLVKIIQIVKIP
ncbi:MAG: hypothetical protein QXD05_00095 [Candidatus Pacearchaeota archaeon]